jgi:hypothetical protein
MKCSLSILQERQFPSFVNSQFVLSYIRYLTQLIYCYLFSLNYISCFEKTGNTLMWTLPYENQGRFSLIGLQIRLEFFLTLQLTRVGFHGIEEARIENGSWPITTKIDPLCV